MKKHYKKKERKKTHMLSSRSQINALKCNKKYGNYIAMQQNATLFTVTKPNIIYSRINK